MAVSVFDLFKIGIGPSSSHTVGPMRAARLFAQHLAQAGLLPLTARVCCELYGSLGATGRGHGSDKAVILGLQGETPDAVEVDGIAARMAALRANRRLALLGTQSLYFDPSRDIVFYAGRQLPLHANGMHFLAFDASGVEIGRRVYYSVGGGFVVSEEIAADGERQKVIAPDTTLLPMPFHSAAELLEHSRAQDVGIAQIMRLNERYWRTDADIDSGLLRIWKAMQDCVAHGAVTDGVLPGWLQVKRRAPALYRALAHGQAAAPPAGDGMPAPRIAESDPLQVLDWVNLYALAVNEENAAGGRVVTAPTNGAAGIVPAVLHYYARLTPHADDTGVCDFLLTAGAIGLLYKENASISGAEVGCQGEVGVACSMAAGALCAVLGGTPPQVENAAEIGMEHHLGLTCDPVGGLVQIPCIERNAMGAVQAINAARIALRGDGHHGVSLDEVIKTMRETGADMRSKYKETARGGLAVNVIEC
ncbi:L-serine dehydratase TdcG [mine drainage metagenome]|uniref:L-serine dehydratase TdcG n=1 Tax=mine drainage metagenome TaxID=410659 RepID=A0A1J5QGV5_9ZZZZ